MNAGDGHKVFADAVSVKAEQSNIYSERTPTMRTFISWSMCVRLNVVRPLFIISFVSFPANITSPKHQPVLRRTHPRSNSFSLSRANFSSLQFSTPSNLLRWLFGGSQTTSAAEKQLTDTAGLIH